MCRSTDERTFVAGIGPAVGYGHKFLLARTLLNAAVLASAVSSFAFDFVARQKAGGTAMSYFVAKQLPVLEPCVLSRLQEALIELSYTAWDLQDFAADLGYNGPPFRWDEERRALLRAEFDALMFRLYGVERDDVDYILDTFPIVKRKDEAAFGEYRTKRLILERYDAMADAEAAGKEYQTVLDPPPAHPSVAHPESTRPSWARKPGGSS